jgi:hypothetical protein
VGVGRPRGVSLGPHTELYLHSDNVGIMIKRTKKQLLWETHQTKALKICIGKMFAGKTVNEIAFSA